MLKRLSLLFLVVSLYACGSKLDGTYVDKNGLFEYRFRPNGKVQMTTKIFGLTNEMEMPYEIEDDKVKIGTPQGSVLLTIKSDGSLEGMGTVFTKKK